MFQSIRRHLSVTLALTSALLAAPAYGQVLIPPNIIQKQAEREQKAQRAASDQSNTPKDARQQVDVLRTMALGDDFATATTAVRTLRSLGEPAKPTLRDVVRQLLARDRTTVENARGLPSAADMRELSDKIADERKAARENIKKLAHDETLKIARTHYDSLKGMWEKLHGAFAQADATAKALSRRAELLALWHDLMPADKQYSDDAEAKLAAKAQRAFGFTPAQLSSLVDVTQPAPAEAVLRDIWFYRACRRIDAFNATLAKYMTAAELENARFVNTYREYLGILPNELDPRLVQAARDHAQEMVNLKYFAHESPVPENRTPTDRVRKAGYPDYAGENIAYGSAAAEDTFWMWFGSPPHHQNMTSPRHTALGVGNVGNTWTQDMGGLPRLMLASPEDRKAALANVKPAPKDR